MLTGTQLSLCKESCNVVDEISDQCKSEFTLIEENRFGALFDYLHNFNCSSPESYLIPDLPFDTEKCIQADDLCELMCACSCMNVCVICHLFYTCS